MRVKNIKLKWHVLAWSSSQNKVINYNVFGESFKNDLYKQIKTKKITNYEELKDYVKKWAMYYYWSKSECEMAIGPLWPDKLQDLDKFEKIDIYRQIEMNLDHIIEYLISIMEIKF